MDDDRNAFAGQVSGDDEDGQTGAVDPGFVDEAEANATEQEEAPHDPSDVIKKRLGMQAKKHQREMRAMQEQMQQMQAQFQNANMDSANPYNHQSHNSNPYPSPGQPNPPGMTEEERIHKAVRYALGEKDHQERQAKEAQHANHVQKQYHRLNEEFDKASDKYDDFDDVVRGDDMPFTHHVRDALLLVENPAEVAYRLGKNKSELERISRLHPLDQAREVNKLSFSLMGNHGKPAANQKTTPLGSIKQNPAHSSTAITDKTPPSTIRARMKAGTWK
ncbi:hypothetical protein UFOVP100_46 [uncultured Caudovirales phage]|uniref:Uncharacterized protein n=1 Tax=uncultured Caudovirales phage TaxID=2100421 RepID=A0A6J5L1T5_9CAUD|nr:hypothetical protein UFOVP100_46 [uncultured Caudovirales phage]